ncbi:MAG: hypothetical protein A3I06_11750 [Candidatus Lindowbacteria bacterium RIFCSPLOWO2_02_FULL_62_12]|nr:MAG: hypothetical protein A3I06_11750 [Candidatus Lindowbacteria bacterium RIFCSPLOWO2_02_FULL_62_12]
MGNGYAEGSHAQGLVIDTQTLVLTESAETSAVFRSDTVVLTDTLYPAVEDGRVSWGRQDTIHVKYVDVHTSTDSSADTALAIEIPTVARAVFYEDTAYGDEVDTFYTRDVTYIAVHDTDENRNPQMKDTVQVTVFVGNGTTEGTLSAGISLEGLVIDTQTLVLTESGETSGVFLSDALALTDTEFPVVENTRMSWGRTDTLHVTYTDITGLSEVAVDTALALETGTRMAIQLYEDSAYTDDVDTYLTKDVMYILVQDTDENRNPHVKDTIFVVVRVGNDTNSEIVDSETIILTESSETGGIFLSGAIVLTDTVSPVPGDGILSWGLNDTTHVLYVDATDGTDVGFDTALAIEIRTPARVVLYEDQAFGDEVDTYFTRDYLYVAVHDTDENRNPQSVETTTVTVFVSDNAYNIIIDTEVLLLTESGQTTGIFRSDTVVLTDTKLPLAGDGIISWGRSDTLHVAYTDPNFGTDTAFDTALALEITTAESVAFFAFDNGDTFLLPDTMGLEVSDIDANLNPQTRDTVLVYVTSWNANRTDKILIDTETIVLTETSETSGVFRIDMSGLLLSDTMFATGFGNGKLLAGRGDTLLVEYFDQVGVWAEAEDTAYVGESAKPARLRLLADGLDTDVFGTGHDRTTGHDSLLIEVVDEDMNVDPQETEAILVLIQVPQTGDSEYVWLTEVRSDSEIWRGQIWISDTITNPSDSSRVLLAANFDTVSVQYVDSVAGTDSGLDTALIYRGVPSLADFYDSVFLLRRDTYVRIEFFTVQITDTDENENPYARDTITITVVIGDPANNGALRETEVFVLTETTDTSGVFRTDKILGSDTIIGASLNDGQLKWQEGDSVYFMYVDNDDPSDSDFDSAIIKSAGKIAFDDTFYFSLDTITLTVRDFSLNINQSVREVVMCTVMSPTVGDTEILWLTETGETTGIFSNNPELFTNNPGSVNTLLASETAYPIQAFNRVLTVRPGDSILVAYWSIADTSTSYDTRAVIFQPTQSAVRLDRANYNTNRRIFITVNDSDQRGFTNFQDTVVVYVFAATGGDSERVVLSETLDSSATPWGTFFSGSFNNDSTAGLAIDTGPAAQDGILNAPLYDTIFVRYDDNYFVFEGSTDSAILLPVASKAFVRLLRQGPGGWIDADTYAIGDSVFVEVTDSDYNLDLNFIDSVTIAINSFRDLDSPSSAFDTNYLDTEFVTLWELDRSAFVFRALVTLPTETGPRASVVPGDSKLTLIGGLDIVMAGYRDTYNLEFGFDTAGISQPSVKSGGRFTDTNNITVTNYDASFHDRMYIEVTDTNQNKSAITIETVSVRVIIEGTGDSEIVVLTEIAAHAGIFRAPDGVQLLYKYDTGTDTAVFDDGKLLFRNADTAYFVYVDPDSGLDTFVSDTVEIFQLGNFVFGIKLSIEPQVNTTDIVLYLLSETGAVNTFLRDIRAAIEIVDGSPAANFVSATETFVNGVVRFVYPSATESTDFIARVTVGNFLFEPFIRIRPGQKFTLATSKQDVINGARTQNRVTAIFDASEVGDSDRIALAIFREMSVADQTLVTSANSVLNLIPGVTPIYLTDNEAHSEVSIQVYKNDVAKTKFDKNVSIIMQYGDTDADGIIDRTTIREKSLAPYFVDVITSRWKIEPTFTVNDKMNYVEAVVNHLTIFAVLGRAPAATVDNAIAYPNPFKPNSGLGHTQVFFDNLPDGARIRIYDVSGQIVDEIDMVVGTGRAVWDATNKHGISVASGVYIYMIEGGGARKIGKVMVIK